MPSHKGLALYGVHGAMLHYVSQMVETQSVPEFFAVGEAYSALRRCAVKGGNTSLKSSYFIFQGSIGAFFFDPRFS